MLLAADIFLQATIGYLREENAALAKKISILQHEHTLLEKAKDILLDEKEVLEKKKDYLLDEISECNDLLLMADTRASEVERDLSIVQSDLAAQHDEAAINQVLCDALRTSLEDLRAEQTTAEFELEVTVVIQNNLKISLRLSPFRQNLAGSGVSFCRKLSFLVEEKQSFH